MFNVRFILLLCIATAFSRDAFAQFSFGDSLNTPHTQTRLLLSADSAKPGDTIFAAVEMKMDDGWHTYWRNPGTAGQATDIRWKLPPGFTAGSIQWPLPQKLEMGGIAFYGYETETVLIIPIKIAADAKPSTQTLTAEISWLECKEQCVPGAATNEITLTIGNETKSSTDAPLIQSWQAKVPQTNAFYQFHAQWETATNDRNHSFVMSNGNGDADKNIKLDAVDFFPDTSDAFEVQPATEIFSTYSAQIQLRKSVKKFSGDWPKEISGVVVTSLNGQRTGYEVKVPLAETGQTSAPDFITLPPQPLWQVLLYAFIGGLILNIMPCVLPVIALKILGFVSEAKSSPRRVRALGGIYAIGVLVSFLALAGVVIGVQAAGKQAGWGMQFGSPIFIVCLTTLVTLVALNLFGVFEVTLGGHALNTAGELASKHGAAGAFFNGVLATILATPCTAPFLSIALGFAFAQSAPLIILIFLTIGLGLAAPYVLLSWHPVWLKFLPKPGAWMEKFKIVTGFPMLTTAIWLFNLAASNYGKNVLWLGIFLVIVALAAWIFGEFVQRGRKAKSFAWLIILILLVGGYAFALENRLHWRVISANNSTGSLQESPDGVAWQRWSTDAVAAARDAGHAVLVDFTADWCITCQANQATSLEIPSVRAKLKESGIVALQADYTHLPPEMTAELHRYGRAGVPLVLVFPKDANASAIVLPEILTPGIVLDALERASK